MAKSSFFGPSTHYVPEDAYSGAATDSLVIGTGPKTFTIGDGHLFAVGQWINASSDSDPTGTYMNGPVSAITDDTVTIAVDNFDGAGTHTDWTLTISGTRGSQGGPGPAGPAAWNAVVAWSTAHAFVVGPPADVVTQGGSTYVCIVPHTSGTFATDLAAGKWVLVAQAGGGVSGGTANGVVYATDANDGTSTAALTDGQLVVGQTGAAPLPKTVSGDVTLSAAGAIIVANSAITNAKQANMAAGTFKGNNTGAPAAPIDLTAAQMKTALAIAAGDVSGLAAVASSGSASDLGTGTLPAARLPAPTATLLGGVKSLAAAAHQWLTQIGTDGSVSQSQPAFTDISGSVAASQMPALTGDVTTTAGAVATTIAAGVVTFAKMAAAALATTAQYLANTTSLILTTDKVWAAAVPVALTAGATVTPDFNAGINFTLTANQNFTLANATNQKAGQAGVITITQDATGSRVLTLVTNYKAAGGASSIVLSTTASAVDDLYYYVVASGTVHVSLNKAYS
jgi:hypothetical protein